MGDRSRAKWAGKWGGGAVPLSVWVELGPHLTQCQLGRGLPPYQVVATITHTNVTDRQTDRYDREDNGQIEQDELLLVTAWSLYACAPQYVDKSNGDGVETEEKTPSHSA